MEVEEVETGFAIEGAVVVVEVIDPMEGDFITDEEYTLGTIIMGSNGPCERGNRASPTSTALYEEDPPLRRPNEEFSVRSSGVAKSIVFFIQV
jgi:hypothetical protein